MHRRQFLASLPLAADLAGCGQLSGSPSETPRETGSSETPNDSETKTRSPATGTEEPSRTERTATPVSETAAVVRPVYRHRFYADAFRFVRPDRVQFLFVRVPAASADQHPSSFELVVGDRRLESTRLEIPPLMPRVNELHTVEEPSGWIGFDVPRVESAEATLVGPNHEYALPSEAADALGGVPDLVVESVSAPDRVAVDEAATVEVTVRNDGDRRGVFLGGFQRGGVPSLMEVEVDPGDTEAALRTFEPYESGGIALTFRHPGGSRRLEIDVVGTETPTESNTQ